MVMYAMIEFFDHREIKFSTREIYSLCEITIANLILTISIGILVSKLHREKYRIEAINQELTKSKEQIHNIFDNLDVAIWSFDVRENTYQVSSGMEKLYDVPRQLLIKNQTILRLDRVHPDDTSKAKKLEQTLFSGRPDRCTYRIIRPNGEIRWVENRGVPLIDERGEIIRIDSVVIDVTDNKQAHDKIKRLAFYDALTDLPNRRSFEHHLMEALNYAKDCHGELSVLFIDLDGFKQVNDTLGHDVGDLLLKEVAARLRSCVPEENVVSRYAGDEFTVLLPKGNVQDAGYNAKKIVAAFQTPIIIKEKKVEITLSIGISVYPEHGEDAETLMRYADTAMYQVKKQGKNNYHM